VNAEEDVERGDRQKEMRREIGEKRMERHKSKNEREKITKKKTKDGRRRSIRKVKKVVL
jgi:hypothetical protein